MHQEFHQAMRSFASGKLPSQILCKRQYLQIFSMWKLNRSIDVVLLTLASSEVINTICHGLSTCTLFIILATPTLHLIEFTVGGVSLIGFSTNLNSTPVSDSRRIHLIKYLPSNVHLLDLRIGVYMCIRHCHLCSKRTFLHLDIFSAHIDLGWISAMRSHKGPWSSVYLENHRLISRQGRFSHLWSWVIDHLHWLSHPFQPKISSSQCCERCWNCQSLTEVRIHCSNERITTMKTSNTFIVSEILANQCV